MLSKAVIMKADRTNDIVILRKKNLQGRTFQHGGCTYFLHPDRFQVTYDRPPWKLKTRRYFSTFYYTQGISNPLPVPDFKPVISEYLKSRNGTDGKTRTVTIQEIPEDIPPDKIKEFRLKQFKDIVDNGIPAEELAAIFNPWFYRVIASQSRSLWEQIQFWLTIGVLIGVIYVAFMLTTGNYSAPPIPVEPTPPTPPGILG